MSTAAPAFDCANQTVYNMKFCSVYNQNECAQMNTAITVTPKITSMLSMIGVTLIIYRFLAMKPKNRKTYDRLIFGMSCMNFWGGLGFFLGQYTFPTIPQGAQTSAFCNWQGWLLQINSAVFWYNSVLATNFVLRIRFGWSEEKARRYEPYMHLVAWAYPVITSFIALGLNMYGKAGLWCWISIKYDWARWAFFYVFLWIIMIYATACMVLIVLTVKQSDDQTAYIRESNTSTSGGGTKPKRKKLGKKTRQVAIQATLYVATFLLTWVFGTANRIQNAVVASNPNQAQCTVFALVWLHSFFVPAQGFFNFIVYIYPRVQDSKKKKKQHDVDSKKDSRSGLAKCGMSIKEGFLAVGFVLFGWERLERSDSKRDSLRGEERSARAKEKPNAPSQNPSGEVPSEMRSNDDENDESNSDQKPAPLAKAASNKPRDVANGNGTHAAVVEIDPQSNVSPASTIPSKPSKEGDDALALQ